MLPKLLEQSGALFGRDDGKIGAPDGGGCHLDMGADLDGERYRIFPAATL